LDFNQLSRTKQIQQSLEQSTADFVMIDHQQEPTDYAKITFSETTASSTCELLYSIIDDLGESKNLTPEMAKCLYLGIMTDTGSFKFASTTSATHRTVAHLIDAGARPEEIHQQIFDNNSLNKLKIQAKALKNLEVIEEARTAFTFLSDEEMNSLQTEKGDTEGIVNMGLSIKGIRFAAFFKERKQEGLVKISLRSKGEFDVNKVARKYFEGGGHKNAAGGKSEKNLEETLDDFRNKVIAHYKNQLQ
jgi:phosphoesterase RecJ-like protein